MCAISIIEEHCKRVTFSVLQGNRHADRQQRVQSLSEDSEAHTCTLHHTYNFQTVAVLAGGD